MVEDVDVAPKRCLSILTIQELYKEDNLEMEVHYDE